MKRIFVDPLAPSDELVAEIVTVLARGGVVIYPTDTCYGIGAEATNLLARQRIHNLKRWRGDKPAFSIIIPSPETMEDWIRPTPDMLKALRQHLPGPFSFIVPTKIPEICALPNVAIRYPDYALTKLVGHSLGRPFSTTSANISYEPSIYRPDDIETQFLGQHEPELWPDLFVDAGELPINPPSTIVDLTQKPPQLVRQGSGIFNG